MTQPIGRNCGAHIELERQLRAEPAYQEKREEIERLTREFASGMRTSRPGITYIRTVIHVVWHTENQNVSDDQIQSQFAVLNQDFRARNANITQVPSVWKDLAADARIQFFLATTDPVGNSTTGITRTQTELEVFLQEGNPVKASATGGVNPWPTDKYLNIWVCNLQSRVGYAQFPGLAPETDGVVISYSAFGTTGTAIQPFNGGRTATHEIGHWLNLLHIWGDDGTGCVGTDLVDDTPNAAGSNTGCPTYPKISCDNRPHGDMFMNYMDYTDDACMCMFTAGQMLRMQATLDGPRALIGSQNPPQAGGI